MDSTHDRTLLQLPSFLHGSCSALKRKAKAEGQRCARQYQLDGSFPQPRELLAVAPDEAVFTHNAVDFHDERPAWRLYLFGEVISSLCDSFAKSYRQVSNAHEVYFRETAWGALYFALSGWAPDSAERTAARLESVLRFWDSLQHGRYLHQELNELLTLEELLSAACGWALDAWSPEEEASFLRSRFEVAAERMARATRADCTEAILRQLPRILSFADVRKLHHPAVVTNPDSWREHLATLNDTDFERISGVRPGWVLERLYLWDSQLDGH
jgi:hypothetical protein